MLSMISPEPLRRACYWAGLVLVTAGVVLQGVLQGS